MTRRQGFGLQAYRRRGPSGQQGTGPDSSPRPERAPVSPGVPPTHCLGAGEQAHLPADRQQVSFPSGRLWEGSTMVTAATAKGQPTGGSSRRRASDRRPGGRTLPLRKHPSQPASEDGRRSRAVAGVAALLEAQPVPLERAVRPWFGPRGRQEVDGHAREAPRGQAGAGNTWPAAGAAGARPGPGPAPGGACGPRRAAAAPAGRAGSSPAAGGPGRPPPRPAAASGPRPSARSAPVPGPAGPPSRPAGWGSAGRGPVRAGRGPVSRRAGGRWVQALPLVPRAHGAASVLTRDRGLETSPAGGLPARFYLNWAPSTGRREAPLSQVRGRDGRGGAGRAGGPPRPDPAPPPRPRPLRP